MIHIAITIEQAEDGQMNVTFSSPEGQATVFEQLVYQSISHAVNVMLAMQGGNPVEIPVTKEMKANPARN